MADKFDMPIRISAIDHVGTYNENAAIYRGRAVSELKTLYAQMQHQALIQCKRTVNIGNNVIIDCLISFGVAFVTITVGAEGAHVKREKDCFCSTFCLVAGRVISTKDEDEDDDYPEDGSYRADIHICQQPVQGLPRLVETADVYESAGRRSLNVSSSLSIDFSVASVVMNVPYTDRFKHKAGDSVLVLIAPLVDYLPLSEEVAQYGGSYEQKNGSWSPETNRRRIVSGYFERRDELAEAPISTKYEKSTGLSGSIMRDAALWKDEPKFCPFRILPLSVPSCFQF